ncbi:hypothetical protein Tco_0823814 [Tanacetum coccineum]|uniref:Uncharacterized protein n=1 Tax=Tanacetum coccineum TaxID=301880 RepID=A0ABQ5AIX6_9ASTR
MPPRRFKKKSVRKIVEKRVAKAIEKYEKTRADSNNAGGSGSTNTGGTVVPEILIFVCGQVILHTEIAFHLMFWLGLLDALTLPITTVVPPSWEAN